MSVSLKNLDVAFQGSGQKPGMEIWHIQNSHPIRITDTTNFIFFPQNSYIILRTKLLKSGGHGQEIHYWIGKDACEEDSRSAALKSVELDGVLGGRSVQHRELQGRESDKFLSYFKPCIIPHHHRREDENVLYLCRGKHVVHVEQVVFVRTSLSHDHVFILDTKSKIFQFNGSKTTTQERSKALEVVDYLNKNYHDGKCHIATIDDGKMMADADTGEFWGLFGGFAPLPRKLSSQSQDNNDEYNSQHLIISPPKLLCIEKDQTVVIEAAADGGDSPGLRRDQLDNKHCYVLDCGLDVFVWFGRNTCIEDRKSSIIIAHDMVSKEKGSITAMIQGCETVNFRSKFSSWTHTDQAIASEEGRPKFAALLKFQGLENKVVHKASHLSNREEPQAYIDCTGNLQVWRVNSSEKTLIPSPDQTKFYSGDCYIFQYNYSGEEKEEVLVGVWFGKKSIQEERTSAVSLASKMAESMKFHAVQAFIYEGKEPIQFFAIFQSFIVFKGGISSGYKNYIAENEITDSETYSEDGVALFRVQGYGPDNMQAIQVDPVGSSLNSSYCYILHSGDNIFTWTGSLTTSIEHELAERLLDLIKPNGHTKPQKEGNETYQFWSLIGGKCEHGRQKMDDHQESDPHLFSSTLSKGEEDNLKVTEIFNFTQDDLMTEDILILDCHSNIYVWVGHEVTPTIKSKALNIGQKFLQSDFLLEKPSKESTIFVITEENEPSFFTRFFTWDSAKSTMHGNSFQRKLAVIKNGINPTLNKPKRRVRTPVSYGGGRSAAPTDKSQRARSMSFSPDRVRVRGRSPAFNALASNFEKNSNRNLSTPPPVVNKLYPKSDGASKQIAFVRKDNQSLTIQEDVKEGDDEEEEDEEGLLIFSYERLKTDSIDPITEIDITKREEYLSSEEFKQKFGMKKSTFFKLPKWKQNKLKTALKLF